MAQVVLQACALSICLITQAIALPSKRSISKLIVSGNADAPDHDVAISVAPGLHLRREASGESVGLLHKHIESSNTQEVLAKHDVASVRKPTGENLTVHPPTLSAEDAADRLTDDGLVKVFNAPSDSSQVIKLEEETQECMMDTPVWECMEKHGSYGVRRLYTDSVDDYDRLDNWRKDWMSHPEVQRKTLFDITWPGTHDSGAYGFDPAILDSDEGGKASAKGAITQHLDVYTQLDLGVRAIEVQIAVGKKDGQLYSANGFLMMSLATILTDIASFLETQKQEVVLLYMRKADVWNGVELAHIQPLKDEENNPDKIPGESVHKGVQAIIGKHLATYKTLEQLPSHISAENPPMGAAISAGIRVFYFWEGQQVLCVEKAECAVTPGWERGNLGQPLAFGPGLPYGARSNMNRGTETQTYVEPGCIHPSATATQSTNPIQLLLNIKKHAGALMNSAKSHPTKCFPTDGAMPEVHHPTLLYEADVWTSPYSEAEGAYRKVYKDVKEIFTRGESATLKSEAERVNFLALNWLLRKNWQPLFQKLNIISMDYVAPINVHRIIEANQKREECGYAIYCKATGSCWAQTLLDSQANACKDEPTVLAFLKNHAEGQPWPVWVWILAIGLTAGLVKLTCCTLGCYAMGNKCCPTFFHEGAMGIMWLKRKPKGKKEEALLAEDDNGDAVAEPEQQEMDSEEQTNVQAPAL